jgi:hypothetical protein
MNVLDENVPESQRALLRSKRVPLRQVGQDLGRKGMKDRDIIALLHGLDRPTFFTLDGDFYDRRLRHEGYCLVHLDVEEEMAATFVRRLLRHRELNTKAENAGSRGGDDAIREAAGTEATMKRTSPGGATLGGLAGKAQALGGTTHQPANHSAAAWAWRANPGGRSGRKRSMSATTRHSSGFSNRNPIGSESPSIWPCSSCSSSDTSSTIRSQ